MFTVNAIATEEKLNDIEYEDDWYLRFQNKNWEIGEQSWEIMYETADEAREAYEEDGLDPDDAVLDGKSCCCTWHEAAEYAGYYDEKDTVVLLIRGFCNCTGHDGEAVVDIAEIAEIYDYDQFCNVIINMGEKRAA